MTDHDSLRLERVRIGDLAAFDLTVGPGEIVCLSGASGSGKTRLLRAIADLEPHDGEVRLGERTQSDMRGHEWRRRVMLVPAESQWWAERVGEHLIEPGREDLERLGFSEAVLGWQVDRLSSGEKQRLALLRAISHEPSSLLLDEPTANLDESTTRRVESWLRSRIQEQGWPVIWVAHAREQIERLASRHFHILRGRLEQR